MKKILLTCCLAFFFLEVYTQNHQTERKFDRDWLFARYGIQADGSYIQEPKNLEKMFTDDSKWRNLDLPHDWAIEGPFQKNLEGSTGKLPWRGIGWYRKHFTVSNRDRNKRFYLDFDGAMANAEVWLNGVKIGARPYGYSSFRVDLTPNLQYGKNNLVAVRLNTEKWGSRWYPGAGIYRHVHLVQVNQVHIAHWGVFVTTPKVTDESATVSVQIEVENHELVGVNCKYKVCLYHLDVDDRLGSKVVESCKEELKIPAQSKSKGGVLLKVKAPQKWDLHSPNRYLARVTVFKDKKKIDTYDVPFGIRTIAFTHDHGFLLNGNRVPINGVCMHHDLGALGTAINSAALRRQIQILKSFGCNAIRTSHNMPAPDLLHLADKLGIMIMDEAFDCWRFSKNKNDYASLFDKWHERDLGDLIRRDRNHPSVILWSTGNEVAEQYRPELGTAKHLTDRKSVV